MECLKQSLGVWRKVTFRSGDVDAFTQLFLNNVGTTLVIAGFLNMGYDPRLNASDEAASFYRNLFQEDPQFITSMNNNVADYVYKRTVGGLAVSLLFGSLYYTWMALRVKTSKEEKNDPSASIVTSLPFGVNTPAAFAFAGGILVPVAQQGYNNCYASYLASGMTLSKSQINLCLQEATHESWSTGVLCNFACGILSTLLSFFGTLIVRYTPRVALLSSLATIAFAFLLLGQLTYSFANPTSGVLPVVLMVLGYFCEITFWKIPTSIAVVLVGAALAWATSLVSPADLEAAFPLVGWQGIDVAFDDIFAKSVWENVPTYIGTIVPFAVQAAVGTLMNVVSAAQAGDVYPVKEAMVIDGVCSIIGSFFSTPIMTSVYIGHPGFKVMGATTSYTLYNAFTFLVFALFGLFAFINGLLPPSSLGPVIAFIGLIICSEAMMDLPKRHNIVFLLGLVPGICNWAGQNGLSGQAPVLWGYVAMGGDGAMLFAMVFTAMVAFACDRNFVMAGAWSIIAALLSAFGLLHQETANVSKFNTPHGHYCVLRSDSNALSSGAWTANGTCGAGYVPCGTSEAPACGYEGTTQLYFMIGYLTAAAAFAIFFLLQKYGLAKEQIIVDIDLDVGEMADAKINHKTSGSGTSRSRSLDSCSAGRKSLSGSDSMPQAELEEQNNQPSVQPIGLV